MNQLCGRILRCFLLAFTLVAAAPALAQAQTFFYVQGDPGEPISGGTTRTFTPTNWTFYVNSYTPSGVSLSLNNGSEFWNASFTSDSGPLRPGQYLNAMRFAPPGSPGMDVSGNGSGCNTITGRFSVLEVSFANGVLQTFAVDFEQHCEGNPPALRGSFRYNSAIPRVGANPVAAPRIPAPEALPGMTIVLDGTRSFDPADAALTYNWVQVSGVTAAITAPDSATASFGAPPVPPGGSDLVFQLTVANPTLASGNAQVKIHVSNAGDRRSILNFRSEVGDYIGDGQAVTLRSSDGTFTARPDGIGGVSIAFDNLNQAPPSTYQWWDANFYPPVDKVLSPGVYVPGRGPTRSRLSVAGNGSACDNTTGRFIIYESVIVNGNVQAFAGDFEQHCEGAAPALYGQVRFNTSVPLVPAYPMASVEAPRGAEEGATAMLDGSHSFDPGGTALTYQWSQVSGPAVTIASPASATTSFVAPAVPPGGADFAFQLTVTNGSGLTSTASATIHVTDVADPKSFLYFESDPGDLVGQGQTRLFTTEDGMFDIQPSYSNGFAIRFQGAETWTASFVPPLGSQLAPGDYPVATRSGDQSPTTAGFEFSGNANCTVLLAMFHVHELVVVNGVVQKFAADFVQNCGSGYPDLRGIVRFNSTVPMRPAQPTASAYTRTYVSVGDVLTLDGSLSRDPNRSALTYQWTQVSGAPVTISAPDPAIGQAIAPAVPPGGSDLVFELRVTNAANQSDTTQVTVHVWNPADAKTFLVIEGDPGEPVSGGTRTVLTQQDGLFISQLTSGTARIRVNKGFYYSWDAYFVPPSGGPLAPGVYPNAHGAFFGTPTKPGISVTDFPRSCGNTSGKFMIWEYVVQNGVLERYAADFEQHCDNASPAMRGSVRFNSSVPLKPLTPLASAVASPGALAGATVSLDASASFDANNSPLTYQWIQVSGPTAAISNATAAIASFTAPAVPSGGADLAFEVAATNGTGQTGTARVTIHVANVADPRTVLYYKSDLGDPIGQGATKTYLPEDGAFTADAGMNYVNWGFSAGNVYWFANFMAAGNAALVPGTYLNVQRFATQSQPGLGFGGSGGACGTVAGKFTILELVVSNGVVQRFAADFEQHCEALSAALRGSIRYNSSVPYGNFDNSPDAFAFTDAPNATPGAAITSNAITVTGLDTVTPVTVTNGAYSIGCTGTFTASPGTIAGGQTVCVRHTAPLAYTTATTTTLTIGGVSGTFRSTTLASLPTGDDDGDGIPNGVEIAEGRNPFVRDNDIFGNTRLFAMQQYRDFLGREGDAGGIQFYTDGINGGTRSRAQTIENFFNSPEFSGSTSPIVRLYFATFLRIPDYGGLLFQVDAFRSGTPLDVIANNFTLSPEFQSRYGALGDAAFVALLYQNVLGRTASQPEIDYHVARLASGVPRGAVLVGFSESPEFQQLTTHDVYVTMMYVGMLRRAPEQAGFDYWVAYMDAGNPGLALILGFLNAPEYRNRFQ